MTSFTQTHLGHTSSGLEANKKALDIIEGLNESWLLPQAWKNVKQPPLWWRTSTLFDTKKAS